MGKNISKTKNINNKFKRIGLNAFITACFKVISPDFEVIREV